MDFRNAWVDSQWFECRVPCLRHELVLRNQESGAHEPERVGQPRVGPGIIWILGDSLLKILRGLLKTVFRPFVPGIAALQIEVIRLVGTGRRNWFESRGDPLLTLTERELNFIRNFLRDFSLKSQQIA